MIGPSENIQRKSGRKFVLEGDGAGLGNLKWRNRRKDRGSCGCANVAYIQVKYRLTVDRQTEHIHKLENENAELSALENACEALSSVFPEAISDDLGSVKVVPLTAGVARENSSI